MPESIMLEEEDSWFYNETDDLWFWGYNIDSNSIKNSTMFGVGIGMGGTALIEIGPVLQPAIKGGKQYLGLGDDALNSVDDIVRVIDVIELPKNTGTSKSLTGGGKIDCNDCGATSALQGANLKEFYRQFENPTFLLHNIFYRLLYMVYQKCSFIQL